MITWQEINKRGEKREKLRCGIFVKSRLVVACNVDAMLSQCSAFYNDVPRMIAFNFFIFLAIFRNNDKIKFESKIIVHDKKVYIIEKKKLKGRYSYNPI